MNPSEIAAQALHRDPASLAPPERIRGGLTNENWLVRAADTAIVVRLGNRHADTLQIDRRSEAAILTAVARANIGPPVLMCDPERQLLVTQHLGATWTARDARSTKNIERIADLLRALHALPPPAGARTVDLQAVVTGYWNALLARGMSTRAGTTRTRTRARDLIADLQSDARAVLCHNDIHHLNVIDNGRLWLVDWEYAGSGDPYFDLASLCCYHKYSDQARRNLLRAYLGQDRKGSLDRLHRTCWVFDYIRELWFAVREME
jgi:thiamine kinase